MADDSAPQEKPAESAAPQTITLVYANAAGVRPGPFDVALDFGYVAAGAEGEPPTATQWNVRVAMSWEHARALHVLIGKQLEAYEESVGTIPDIERLKLREDAQ